MGWLCVQLELSAMPPYPVWYSVRTLTGLPKHLQRWQGTVHEIAASIWFLKSLAVRQKLALQSYSCLFCAYQQYTNRYTCGVLCFNRGKCCSSSTNNLIVHTGAARASMARHGRLPQTQIPASEEGLPNCQHGRADEPDGSM